MNDIVVDAASAAAEPSLAPINENPGTGNTPIQSDGPERQQQQQPEAKAAEPQKPSASVKDAIAKASAKLHDDPKGTKPEAKVDPKPAAKDDVAKDAKPAAKPQRGDHGHFAPKEPPAAQQQADPSTTKSDAPKWLSKEGTARWDKADPDLRRELSAYHDRREREVSQGIDKYRARADRDAALDEFHDQAQRGGTTVKEALTKFVNMENSARQEISQGSYPVRTFEHICSQMGFSLRDMAAAIMGQTPEQQQSQSDATIRELRSQITDLTNRLGGVERNNEQQQANATLQEIQAFASKPEHSRFEELHEDISFFLQSGRAKDLSEAYQLAERLNPAAQPAAKPVTPAVDPKAQTNGQKSIHGAPHSGSSPAVRREPSKSVRDALQRAAASL